jgi:outer membrane immunogenic protein
MVFKSAPWPGRHTAAFMFGKTKAMKKILLSVATLIALGASMVTLGAGLPARAADLGAGPYNKAPVYAAPLYNWTGFYIGGHLGGAFSGDNSFNGLVLSNYDARLLGGVQAGADYQFTPSWVVGFEGQYSWLGHNNIGAIFPAGYTYSNNQRGLGSVTGRIGYVWGGAALLYIKGGYAYSDGRESLTFGGAPVAFALSNTHHDGYTVGFGTEYLFATNWSAKLEYQYYDFGSSRFIAPAPLVPFGSFRNDEHTLKAGVNYRFNWGAPVVARY